ncbi:uncharacterized protein LOC112558575 isoform X4 [Pomacea canaliculata]|uniref:uncharacterized protein LOC112558575 isoform X4 n=1 Tax=Pomacea canaliculata TaxID=400727 RepID=UPI000D727829|nr:uncharacterized protein LOC112558575 isoform X4 [Pomacea canaliculata]
MLTVFCVKQVNQKPQDRKNTVAATTTKTRTTMSNILGSNKQTSPMSRINMKTTKRATTTPVTTRASTTTTNTPCDGISGQHSSYLKDNLDIVRQKCSEFHACTVELYKSENLHRILAGDNIQLRNICGLKGNSTAPLCNSTDVQVTTEKFFNTNLRQYHCTCNTFTEQSAKSLPLVPLVAGVCVWALVLLLIFIIFFLGVRLRKLRETADMWTQVSTPESDGLHLSIFCEKLIFTKLHLLKLNPEAKSSRTRRTHCFQSLKSETSSKNIVN